jgi:hypothetical protein
MRPSEMSSNSPLGTDPSCISLLGTHAGDSAGVVNFFIVMLLTIARISSVVTSTPVLIAASVASTGTCRNITRRSSCFFVR